MMKPHEELEKGQNIDIATVRSFGDEWSRFDQSALSDDEHRALFDIYFGIFPWSELEPSSTGFDMGCGSGRWADLVAPRVALMKLDVEGVEVRALQGAGDALSRIDAIISEALGPETDASNFLNSQGYEIRTLDGRNKIATRTGP